jgi:hypothetical protein
MSFPDFEKVGKIKNKPIELFTAKNGKRMKYLVKKTNSMRKKIGLKMLLNIQAL